MKEKVTVIVPVYNGENTIQKCVESILNQSIEEIKIIIVDDGSNDQTNRILRKLYSDNKKIEVFHQVNKGVSAARNFGLSKVQTKYVAFVDSDDFVDRSFIAELLKGFSGEKIDLSINGIKRYDPIKKINYDISNYKQGIFDNRYMLKYVFFPNGPKGYLCNKMWKISIIRENKIQLDTSIKMAEDLLFTVNYLLYARKIYVSNYCGYNYVHSRNSLSSGVDLKNIDHNFKDANLNYVQSYLKIIKLLSTSKNNLLSKQIAEANLGLIYTTFLRQINLRDYKDKEDIYLNKKIYKESRRYFFSVIKSKNIGLKRKLVCLITIVSPNLMKKLDKSKIKK